MTNPTLNGGSSSADVPSSTRPHIGLSALVLGALALLPGCSGASPGASTTPLPPPAATVATTAAPATAAPAIDAVLAALKPAGATDPAIITAETDDNNLLGRPGGYTARATFVLPGGVGVAGGNDTDRGGSVEIWSDATAAQVRSAFILGQLKANPILGTEYHYLAGPVLVRVTGKVTPANAKKVEDAVKGLPR